MSPFKEPQPRKNSAAEDAKTIIGGNWPPYAREGGEANWKDYPTATEVEQKRRAQENIDGDTRTGYIPGVSEAQWTMTDTEFNQSLATAREEGRVKAFDDLEIRTTALEAAVRYAGNADIEYSAQGTTFLADIFENYLRNGKPS